MTIEQQVIERLRELPWEKQQEVLDFVQSLNEENGDTASRRSLLSLWEALNIDISEQDIAEVRRKMWGNFPRDIS